MRRLSACVLAVCMLLSGCGVIQDSKGAGREVPVSTLDLAGMDTMLSTKKAAVYFLNSESHTLTADLRLLNVKQDKNPAEAAVQALLKGPSNNSLSSVAPEGMTLDFIEFSNGVANVYLKYDGQPVAADQKYVLEMAIANTVVDLLGATSVNVFYNGLREGLLGYPYGPLKKQTGSVDEAYASAKAKYPLAEGTSTEGSPVPSPTSNLSDTEATPAEPKTVDINTVLYFISASGDYILPEVRTITYNITGMGSDAAGYVSAIIDELKKGPKNADVMRSPVTAATALSGTPTVISNDDLTFDIELHFNAMPADSVYTGSKDMELSFAALVYSITGFVPNAREIRFFAGSTPLNTGGGEGTRRSDFYGYVGSSAPLYFQYANSGLLLEVSRSMEQGKIWSALERVRALMRGPQTGDGSSVTTIQYTGMTEKDILSVNVAGDSAYVNLSEGFKEACNGLSEKNEMLLVYAIVNTVTAMDGINKVQFLVDGEQADTLAGHLCIADPFLRNYGIIKNGS